MLYSAPLRWILDPRSHSLEKIFGRTLVLIGALDHVSKSTPTGSNNIALRVSVHWKSNVVRQCYHSPRCCKQRCFVAWPELDSSFPIRQQRTILYAKCVSRCAHSWCACMGLYEDECSTTVERGSSVGRTPDSQSREPGFESPVLPFLFTTPQSTHEAV